MGKYMGGEGLEPNRKIGCYGLKPMEDEEKRRKELQMRKLTWILMCFLVSNCGETVRPFGMNFSAGGEAGQNTGGSITTSGGMSGTGGKAISTGGSIQNGSGGSGSGGNSTGGFSSTGGMITSSGGMGTGGMIAVGTGGNQASGGRSTMPPPMGVGYVTSGNMHGYATTWNLGASMITPSCNGGPNCFPGSNPIFDGTNGGNLCVKGNVGWDPTQQSMASFGFYTNQSMENPNIIGEVPLGKTNSLLYVRAGADNPGPSGMYLRGFYLQLQNLSGKTWCAIFGSSQQVTTFSWSMFNTSCWDNTGEPFVPGTNVASIQVLVPDNTTFVTQFDFCIASIAEL